jgi:DNA-binding GntR family transcriptional regulator
MAMPDEWLDLENDLHRAIMTACERHGLDENLAQLLATEALLECRGRILERMQNPP